MPERRLSEPGRATVAFADGWPLWLKWAVTPTKSSYTAIGQGDKTYFQIYERACCIDEGIEKVGFSVFGLVFRRGEMLGRKRGG
jgi:hypothetical protein